MLDVGGPKLARVESGGWRSSLSSLSLFRGSLREQSWMMELGAIYLALFVIDFLFFPKYGDFFALSPHPFWLPVLLFSLQYGFSRAVAAAVSAITISWLFLPPEQVLGEAYFDYIARSSITPAMWLGTALIVGELRQRQISERSQVDEELVRLRAQAEILSKHCADTKQANLDLQLKIAAGKTAPIEHALIQLGGRQSQDIEQFLACFEDALTSLIGEHKASVFVINEEQGLDLAFQFGWTASDHFRQGFKPDHPLCQAIIARSQIVSSHRSSWDSDVLQGEGEVAIPIQYIYHGGAYGMLKIENAGATTESSEKLRALVLLGREMGIFLEQSALEKSGNTLEREDGATPLRAAG